MSQRLGEYGEVRFRYRGRATVSFTDGTAATADTEAGQLETGELVVLCALSMSHFGKHWPDAISVNGVDDAGWVFEASGLVGVNYLPKERDSGVYLAFHSSQITANRDDQSGISHHRFGLTNLKFTGTRRGDERDYTGRLIWTGPVLPLILAAPTRQSMELAIRQNVTPTDTYHRLGVVRTTAISGEAIVQSAESPDMLWPVIHDLCWLLSVARGTRVEAVYMETVNNEGEVVSRQHRAGLLRPYTAMPLIDHRYEGREATKHFVENGYPAFVERASKFDLLRGVLSAYLDARSDQDFLEFRGVKIAVVAEMLKAAYKRGPASAPKRATFGEVLEAMLQDVGVVASRTDVQLFVLCRNSLIHQGRFYVETATDEQRRIVPPRPDMLSEYFFLVSFLDRFMLRLFGYAGGFIDWSKYPHHEAGHLS
jgi:hypothetical protein